MKLPIAHHPSGARYAPGGKSQKNHKSDIPKSGYTWNFRARLEERGGYAALTTTLLTVVVSLTIIGGFTLFTFREVNINRAFTRSVESRYVAEGGMEDALYRIISGKQISSSETLGVGKGTTTMTITTVGNSRIIRSEGKKESAQQNLETSVDVLVAGTSFYYGVQVGYGGLKMENNSRVEGSVYSNGPITGDPGATITGDAFAAGTSSVIKVVVNGNAQANFIDDSTVGGYASSTTKLDDVIVGLDAHAYELDDTTVGRNAYYTVIDPQSSVVGTRYTPYAGPTNLQPVSMPIPDSTINAWKQDAQNIGTIATGGCSQTWSPPTNPYTSNGGVIDRKLTLNNNQQFILRGTVWVKCDVDVDNGAFIRLDPSYGSLSGVLLSDGWMHLRNNGQFQGSGAAGSNLMLLSTATGGGHHGSTIDLHNNATGAIFYASRGLIYLHPNIEVTELVGHQVRLENNAVLRYQIGLQNVQFSAGPAGGYDIKYWKEVE